MLFEKQQFVQGFVSTSRFACQCPLFYEFFMWICFCAANLAPRRAGIGIGIMFAVVIFIGVALVAMWRVKVVLSRQPKGTNKYHGHANNRLNIGLLSLNVTRYCHIGSSSSSWCCCCRGESNGQNYSIWLHLC